MVKVTEEKSLDERNHSRERIKSNKGKSVKTVELTCGKENHSQETGRHGEG